MLEKFDVSSSPSANLFRTASPSLSEIQMLDQIADNAKVAGGLAKHYQEHLFEFQRITEN